MHSSLWQKPEQLARQSLPAAITILFTFLGVAVWPLPYFEEVAPPLALISVYYWAIHRPDLFRPSMVFIIGLLNDVLHSFPLGLSAFLFVAMHQLVFRQRRFFAGHSFFMMWWGFALTIIIVLLTEWSLLCAFHWHIIPLLPVALQCALAIIIFPLPCWLLIRLQRAVLSSN